MRIAHYVLEKLPPVYVAYDVDRPEVKAEGPTHAAALAELFRIATAPQAPPSPGPTGPAS
jgi:hypothetical protein